MQPPRSPAIRLVLASTSPYRRDLLARLGLPFEVRAPEVDEREEDGEEPGARARRLACAKAAAVAQRLAAEARAQPEQRLLVIGSDQVASLDGGVLHKPGTAEQAQRQLRASSGRGVTFHTAVTLHALTPGQFPRVREHVDLTEVRFRTLEDEEIRSYVRREPALESSGGFKIEGLGISLFERVESQDPTALIGLPLIWLAAVLRAEGCAAP